MQKIQRKGRWRALDFMSMTTTYEALKKKYQDFAAPTVHILVDNVDITNILKAQIADVSVQLSTESQASGCSFNLVGEYAPENTAFKVTGGYTNLQIGAKVEVRLGYVITELVFYGLIVELEYVFENEDSAPYIHVECMDAMCLLMKQQNMALFTGRTVSDAVNTMFSQQPFSSYIRGRKVDISLDREEMISNAMEDDFSFVSRYAAEIGYEFFIVRGKVYFRKTPGMSLTLMILGPDQGLRSAKLSLRGTGLYHKAIVVGISPDNNEPVYGEHIMTGVFSKGPQAYKMMGTSEKIVFDQTATSTSDAMKKAKLMIKQAKNSFGRIECQCIGIPELVPGRHIRVTGLTPDAEKGCYLLKVSHTFNDSGFSTSFEARVDSI